MDAKVSMDFIKHNIDRLHPDSYRGSASLRGNRLSDHWPTQAQRCRQGKIPEKPFLPPTHVGWGPQNAMQLRQHRPWRRGWNRPAWHHTEDVHRLMADVCLTVRRSENPG